MGLYCALTTFVFAQTLPVRQGGEYPISGPLNGDQTAPVIAINASGGWAVWQDNGIDGNGLGVGARRLDENLNPVGGVVRVNHDAKEDQERPDVALLRNGGAAFVFQSGRLGFQNVYARFLDARGEFVTKDILVNEVMRSGKFRYTTNMMRIRNNKPKYRKMRIKHIVQAQQERTGGAVVESLADGTVVVAYTSSRKMVSQIQTLTEKVKQKRNRYVTNSVLTWVPSVIDTMQDVYLQLFTPDGEKIGGELRANQFTSFNQRQPAIAPLSDGTFVAAWISEQQRGATNVDVVARLFDRSGVALGNEFIVNTGDRPCVNPGVAASPNGGFTVIWTQRDRIAENSRDIYARAFGPTANAITEAFRVNGHSRGDQYSASITAAMGGQLVLWTSLGQDGSREGVFGRWLQDGTMPGGEFQVNTTSHLRQMHPVVAGDGQRALGVWTSYQTTAAFDLFGQRFIKP